MIRWMIEKLYYLTALLVPIPGPEWCWLYVARARVYFECRGEEDFSGWPWRYRLERFAAPDLLGE